MDWWCPPFSFFTFLLDCLPLGVVCTVSLGVWCGVGWSCLVSCFWVSLHVLCLPLSSHDCLHSVLLLSFLWMLDAGSRTCCSGCRSTNSASMAAPRNTPCPSALPSTFVLRSFSTAGRSSGSFAFRLSSSRTSADVAFRRDALVVGDFVEMLLVGGQPGLFIPGIGPLHPHLSSSSYLTLTPTSPTAILRLTT